MKAIGHTDDLITRPQRVSVLENENRRLLKSCAALELKCIDLHDEVERLRLDADLARMDLRDERVALDDARALYDRMFDRATDAEWQRDGIVQKFERVIELVDDCLRDARAPKFQPFLDSDQLFCQVEDCGDLISESTSTVCRAHESEVE